jgi:hypothetical protein
VQNKSNNGANLMTTISLSFISPPSQDHLKTI